MTINDIMALVVSADPKASRYEYGAHSANGAAYTTWREIRRLPLMHDDTHAEAWAFQIDRFTTSETDEVADEIRRVLDDDVRVAYRYELDYEPDTRYIHHIYDCEGY